MRILCLGDVAISSNVKSNWLPPAGFVPGDTNRILFNWELPIGKLINPIPRTSGPRLLSEPGSVKIIQKWSPGFAALATNHILDAGEDGLTATIAALHQAGFQIVGAGRSTKEIQQPLIWLTSEGCLAVINWVFPETHPECRVVSGPNCWPGVEAATRTIRDLKNKSDWVMVFVHWSDELFAYPQPQDRLLAHELALAGADIVIGHHPHVVRGWEIINSCPVFYSLGNFYFSSILDDQTGTIERQAPRNRESLGVLVSFQQGEKPDIRTISFWQGMGRVIQDPFRRAGKRAKAVSRSLHQFKGYNYTSWYLSQHTHFDRWEYRWRFRLWQLGLSGMIKYMLKKSMISFHSFWKR